MDVTSILKDNVVPLGRFLLRQLSVWVAVVRDPLKVVSEAVSEPPQSILPALSLALFAYLLTLMVAFPRLVLAGMDTSRTTIFIADFVLTFMSFGLIGLTVYVVGWLLGGRGSLLSSLVAGLYLTAFWPIVQLTDYVLSPDLSWLGLSVKAVTIAHMAILATVTVFVAGFVTVKAGPVIGYVHGFSRARAVIATVVQIVLVFAAIFIFLRPLFLRLLASS